MERLDIGGVSGPSGGGPVANIVTLLNAAYSKDSPRAKPLVEALTAFDKAVGSKVRIRMPHDGQEREVVNEVLDRPWGPDTKPQIKPIALLFTNNAIEEFRPQIDKWYLVNLEAYVGPNDGVLSFRPINHLLTFVEQKLSEGRKIVDAVEDYRLSYNRGLFANALDVEVGINLAVFKATWKLPKTGILKLGRL